MSDRLASEVLLSIELETKQQTQYLKNIDMMVKNLANRITVLEKRLEQIKVETKSEVKQEVKPEAKPLIPGLKPGVVFKNGKLVNERKEEQEEFTEKPEEKLEVSTDPLQRRDIRPTNNQRVEERRTPAQQRILYKDGKPVTLAKIEIIDQNGNSIYSGKTSSMGKWVCQIPPGNYTVNVLRKATSTKPHIEVSYSIEIPKSSNPVQLPDEEV